MSEGERERRDVVDDGEESYEGEDGGPGTSWAVRKGVAATLDRRLHNRPFTLLPFPVRFVSQTNLHSNPVKCSTQLA